MTEEWSDSIICWKDPQIDFLPIFALSQIQEGSQSFSLISNISGSLFGEKYCSSGNVSMVDFNSDQREVPTNKNYPKIVHFYYLHLVGLAH